MKIEEILSYDRDQRLMRRIGDAFLQNGQLKLPVDFTSLVSDPESMLDQTVDEVPDDYHGRGVLHVGSARFSSSAGRGIPQRMPNGIPPANGIKAGE